MLGDAAGSAVAVARARRSMAAAMESRIKGLWLGFIKNRTGWRLGSPGSKGHHGLAHAIGVLDGGFSRNCFRIASTRLLAFVVK